MQAGGLAMQRSSVRLCARMGAGTASFSTALLAAGWLALAPAAHAGGVAGTACPGVLADGEGGEAASCVLVDEATLASALGNADVLYRGYSRLVPGDMGLLIDRMDEHVAVDGGGWFSVPNAVTLALADDPQRPFWWIHYRLLAGWVVEPRIVRHPEYGELLVVTGVWTGTGHYTDEFEFLGRGAWVPVVRDYEHDLYARLPDDDEYWIREGRHGLDYGTLENTDELYRIHRDANCCATGGEIRYRLRLELPRADAAPPLAVNSGNPPPHLYRTGSHAVLLGGRAAEDVALPRLVLDAARYVPPPPRASDPWYSR